MQVGHVMPSFDGVITQFIGGTMCNAAFDAATRQPDTKAEGVMIASIGFLRTGCATKF